MGGRFAPESVDDLGRNMHLDKLQVGIHRTRSGEVWQANNPNDELNELFETLRLKIPPRILSLPIPRGDRV
ncbi:MAG TPA: hypothetical protein DDZ84_13450 [Firmicutes bacterium]|nr:hypothetical protein [Bacillota bacterium]